MTAHTNRLIEESSPYLRQHAHNPVDWYPWGPEALAAAREQNRPIFLSIGYSACHWCHVMERESFESDQMAALMNQWFINIKVDREERPDLDQIYMNAVVALTGRGGWPMSVFLTPDGRPFYGGTYWPPEARYGQPGFREVLTAVHDAWQNRRDALLTQADELTQAVESAGRPPVSLETLSETTLRNAQAALIKSADRTHGGFGQAPKFPHSMDLRVLLRTHRRFGTAEALEVVRLTLTKMAHGGIYDHLGGGFARYSTDAIWLAPHFEKMLYDNALLVPAYLETYQVTGDGELLGVVRETLDYVLREMTSPDGGFYSTQDADSEGEEGKFFVWTEAEIQQLLGADDGRLFCEAYDVTAAGNWEHHNILNRRRPWSAIATEWKLSADDLESRLARCRATLFDARELRIKPGRDEKILASWNGLMISAMAQAAAVLHEPRYATAAGRAADFVLSKMRTDDGRLWHGSKEGVARFNGYLDDYAGLIDGLVDVYQVTFEPRYLTEAVALAERMIDQFWDTDDAGFFYTSRDHETLITRSKEVYDNATPSGNSLAATALIKLARLTGRSGLEERAQATLNMLSVVMIKAPMAAGQAFIAFDFLLGPAHEIVFCPTAVDAQLPPSLFNKFLPNKVVARRPAGVTDHDLPAVLRTLLADKTAVDQQPTLYICQSGACQRPAVGKDIDAAIAELS